MEFFESCKTTDTDILELKNILVINKLPELCRSISKVLSITMESDHSITIHCTINKNEHDPDFIRSIEEFVYDWKEGLEILFKK